jgi:hypothetical protein
MVSIWSKLSTILLDLGIESVRWKYWEEDVPHFFKSFDEAKKIILPQHFVDILAS